MARALILFDLGGVLADLGNPPRAMRLNLTQDEFWSIWLDSKSVMNFEKGLIGEHSFLSGLASELAIEEPVDAFRYRLLRWRLRLFPDVVTTISKLRREFDIALLSNTNVIHWNMVRTEDDFEKQFDSLFLSFDTGLAKPARAAFENVLDNVTQDPQDICFLDDSDSNISAARSVGIDARRVDGRTGWPSVLSAAGIPWPKDQAGC